MIRGYIAASVDGFIADSNGNVDWLEPFNAADYGYDRFYAEIGTLVMGRHTYDQCRRFGPDWVYSGKRSLVVTSRPIDDPPPEVSAWQGSIAELGNHLRRLEGGDAWVVGGSCLQSAMIECGDLDLLEVFVMPVLLGDGVPLFRRMQTEKSLVLETSETYDNGVVAVRYRLS